MGKCRCNQIVTVTRCSLVTNQSFGACKKCHCKQGVTVNSVTVSGEICTFELRSAKGGVNMEQRCKDGIISFAKKLIFLALFGYFASKVIISVEKEERKGS